MVIYTSVLVQQNRRASELASTSVPLTATAQDLLARRSTPVPRPQEAISPATAGRVAELARWGQGGVLAVTWSPDGRLLAVGTTIGVYLFDGVTLEQLHFLATSAHVAHLSFSPDHQELAVDLAGKSVQLWQVADGTPRQTLADFPGPVRAVAYSPDGSLLVAGVRPTGWSVWTWRDGTVTTLNISVQPIERALWETVPVAVSADARVLAAAGPDGTVRVWRLADGALLHVVQGEFRYASDPKTVSVLALTPDGRSLAYALGGWVQVVWLDEGSDSPPASYPVPTEMLAPSHGPVLELQQDMYTYGGLSLAFSSDGQVLAAGSWDGTLWVWRLGDRSGALLRLIETGQGPAWGLAFSPDGVLAAVLPQAGSVEVWQPGDGSLLHSLLGRTSWLQAAAFFRGGQDVAVGGVDGRVVLWRVADGAPWKTLPGEENAEGRPIYALRTLAVDPSGVLAGGTVDGTVRLWDTTRGELSRTLFDAARQGGSSSGMLPLRTVVLTSDGLVLTTYSSPGGSSAGLVRVDDGHILASLVELIGAQVYLPSVESVAFSPDGQLLAAGSDDGAVWLWNAASGVLLDRLEDKGAPVRSVAFSPDGRLLAAGSHDGAVRLWQVSDCSLQRTLTGHQDWVRAVAFSPDGAVLASASLDGTVRLWRVDDGYVLRVLDRAPATALAYSPDGRILAIGYSDGTVELVDETHVTYGPVLGVLEGHTLSVLSLSFSPDGTLLLSTSQDGTVQLWGVKD
jgi:WD40 repeat protein